MIAVAEFDGVVKDYPAPWPGRRRLRAVDGVSLRIEPGEVLGLLGPNRAGKTTLVKLLLSLCRPTAGHVARLGRPADDRSTLGRIGYVHEHPAFPHYLTAAGLLDYYGAMTGVSRDARRHRIPDLLARVGLADRAGEPIARFSKGMVQRIGIAQALINDPELLVMDEPGEGLDLPGRLLVVDLLRDAARRGRSSLLITHDVAGLDRLCDRVVVLKAGRVAYEGPPAGLIGDRDGSLEEALSGLY